MCIHIVEGLKKPQCLVSIQNSVLGTACLEKRLATCSCGPNPEPSVFLYKLLEHSYEVLFFTFLCEADLIEFDRCKSLCDSQLSFITWLFGVKVCFAHVYRK